MRTVSFIDYTHGMSKRYRLDSLYLVKQTEDESPSDKKLNRMNRL